MMIKCSECGKDVSTKAAACPHCGCPVTTTPEKVLLVPHPPVAETPAQSPAAKQTQNSKNFAGCLLTSVRVWIGALALFAAVGMTYDALFVSKAEKDKDLQQSAVELSRHDDAQAKSDFYRDYDRASESTGKALADSFVAGVIGLGFMAWGVHAAKKRCAT